MDTFFIIFLLAINIVTFFVYGIDKFKAKKNSWRISEKSLILLAVFGGSIGAWCGIKAWKHKTKHQKFTIGIPVILLLQIGIFIIHKLYF